jgi:hypothetical protein
VVELGRTPGPGPGSAGKPFELHGQQALVDEPIEMEGRSIRPGQVRQRHDRLAAYLAPLINDIVPGTAQQAMYAVGVVEILAGIAVALMPRYGALLVAAWLAGIIVNLLLIPGYYDIALRDFGLLVAALALSRLAVAHDGRGHGSS